MLFRSMNVTVAEWREKMNNLMERRQLGTIGTGTAADKVRDYSSHLSKVFIGKSVLDVGCGDGSIETLLPKGTIYHGMDAFPMREDILQGNIEDRTLAHMMGLHDTVIAFAVLDGVQDFDAAILNMKYIAQKNIVILTGLGIPPDRYHTLQIEWDDLSSRFTDWKTGYVEEIAPKVWLIEFKR